MNNHKRKMPTNRLLLSLLLLVFTQSALSADWLYTMRPGDTIWQLCQEYTKEPACWQKLGPLNNIDRDRAIPPGTRIRVPASWLKVPPASASIDFVQGDVRYQPPGEPEKQAQEGDQLAIGAKLITGEGTASLGFADGSSMVLAPHSQLELDSLSNFELNGMVDSTVRLNQGTLKTRVIKREPRSHFQTITPSAVAAVRGTEYRVNVPEREPSQQTTLVEVYQGLVDVGSEQVTIPVPASFGIVAKQGEKLQAPVKLLDPPTFMPFSEQQSLMLDHNGKPVVPIVIEWQAVELASGFQLNILADSKASVKTEKLLKGYRTQSNSVNLNDLPVGCYQLRLRAIDSLGLHGMAQQARLCVNQQLAAPKPTALILSADNLAQQVQIQWQEVHDAERYRIDLSDSPEFTSLLSSREVAELSVVIDQQPADLYMRVQALGKNGLSSTPSQLIHVPAKVLPEDDNMWQILISIGMLLLAFI